MTSLARGKVSKDRVGPAVFHGRYRGGVLSIMRNMRVLMALATTTAVMLVPAVAAAQPGSHQRDPSSIELQSEFDHIGAEVHSLTRAGRMSYYIDDGKPGQRAVVFIGGQGTSLQAFQLTEFARTSREACSRAR